jgi:hypothetical protein
VTLFVSIRAESKPSETWAKHGQRAVQLLQNAIRFPGSDAGVLLRRHRCVVLTLGTEHYVACGAPITVKNGELVEADPSVEAATEALNILEAARRHLEWADKIERGKWTPPNPYQYVGAKRHIGRLIKGLYGSRHFQMYYDHCRAVHRAAAEQTAALQTVA